MEDKFKIGKKWFWICLICSILAPLVGLIMGIGLIFEKKTKEALIIIATAAVCLIIAFFLNRNSFQQNQNSFSSSIQDKISVFLKDVKIVGGYKPGDIIKTQ